MTTTAPTIRPIGVPGTEPRRLENFVCGEWVAGTGGATDLFHAVTGAKIAEATTNGIDFKAMVEHATRVGGPALRRMTTSTRRNSPAASSANSTRAATKPDLPTELPVSSRGPRSLPTNTTMAWF